MIENLATAPLRPVSPNTSNKRRNISEPTKRVSSIGNEVINESDLNSLVQSIRSHVSQSRVTNSRIHSESSAPVSDTLDVDIEFDSHETEEVHLSETGGVTEEIELKQQDVVNEVMDTAEITDTEVAEVVEPEVEETETQVALVAIEQVGFEEAELEAEDSETFSFNVSPPLHIKSRSRLYSSLVIAQMTPSEAGSKINSPVKLENADTLKTKKSKIGSKIRSQKHKNKTVSTNSSSNSKLSHDSNGSTKTLTKIRSNGKVDDLRFPSVFNSNSGSFEIASGDSPELMYTPELIPQFHQPNIPVHLVENTQALGIRSSIISDFSFTTGDSFQDYMEDRLVRWKPNDSQHNTANIIEGKHPFDEKNFGKKKKSTGSGSTGFFLFSWLNNSFKSNDDIEKQLSNINSVELERNKLTAFYTAADQLSFTPYPVPDHPIDELNNILKSVHFQHNSSNSILPRSKTIDSNAAAILLTARNGSPSSSITSPTFTPTAVPFSEVELNYHRRSRGDDVEGNGNVYDSMGNEMIDLINGSDNFLTNCLQGVIRLFSC